MIVTFRPFAEGDSAAAMELNAESVAVLSPLDEGRLHALSGLACLHEVAEDAGAVVGFLLAFADDVPYDSVNYQWFASRFKRFVYIDRVVVSPHNRGVGVGRAFYRPGSSARARRQLLRHSQPLRWPRWARCHRADHWALVRAGRRAA